MASKSNKLEVRVESCAHKLIPHKLVWQVDLYSNGSLIMREGTLYDDRDQADIKAATIRIALGITELFRVLADGCVIYSHVEAFNPMDALERIKSLNNPTSSKLVTAKTLIIESLDIK